MQILPSGLSLYDLLLDALRDQGSIDNSTDPSNSLSPTSQQFISGASSMRGSVDPLSWTVARTGAETGTWTGTVNVVGSRAGIGAGAGAWGSNALLGILQRIPQRDLEALQRGVEIASASFRYYQYNSSLRLNDRDIPTRSTDYFHFVLNVNHACSVSLHFIAVSRMTYPNSSSLHHIKPIYTRYSDLILFIFRKCLTLLHLCLFPTAQSAHNARWRCYRSTIAGPRFT